MQPNNPNQFTEKAWEAIARTQISSKQFQQQYIESEHLMKAMLEQEGLTTSILNKVGVNVQRARDYTDDFIRRHPKVSGSSSAYWGRSVDTLLDRADAYRKEFQDEFVSIEHLLLGFAQDDRFGKALCQEFRVDEAKLKNTIRAIRGSQKVTDQNPEGKYQALEKYGRDLTEAAKAGKLDPVIGRDEEIRRIFKFFPAAQKQSGVNWRSRSWKNCDRRRFSPTNCQRRRTGIFEKSHSYLALTWAL